MKKNTFSSLMLFIFLLSSCSVQNDDSEDLISNGMNQSYFLQDGEALNREFPTTFEMPPLEERQNVNVGDAVKLIFEMDQENSPEPSIERMWVQIIEKTEEGYVGELDNDPLGNVLIASGDEVMFEPRHIIQIQED